MCTSICLMNQGKLLASGTVDEVSRQLGKQTRELVAYFIGNAQNAFDWLKAQQGVEDARLFGDQVQFGFSGDHQAQADLLAALVKDRHRLRALEEKRSNIEDILVSVAESNREGTN